MGVALLGVAVWQMFLKENAMCRKQKEMEEFERTGNENKDMLRRFANDANR
jgi:hypothetical protein